MLMENVTPDTVFNPGLALPDDPVFRFDDPSEPLSAQEQYKRLINAEAGKQGLPLGHLADRIGISRSRLHKIIRRRVILPDELRDQLFAALGIDGVRARFCVVMLANHALYDDPDVFLICEAMKGLYCEIVTRRRGEIQVSLRPCIIYEAMGRAFDLLLSHQVRMLEHDRSLQA